MSINWKVISKKYKGKWIALEEDEVSVIGIGKSAEEALNQALKSGYERPILTKVPIDILPYIGCGFSLQRSST